MVAECLVHNRYSIRRLWTEPEQPQGLLSVFLNWGSGAISGRTRGQQGTRSLPSPAVSLQVALAAERQTLDAMSHHGISKRQKQVTLEG